MKTWKEQPHVSHAMGEEFTDIRAPAGTPRFYGVRRCENCGAEQIQHPAGHFIDDELQVLCLFKGET